MARADLLVALGDELTNKDSDEDGLQDWEERLYKTDTTKADTDGDGSLDGLEVQVGTDPLDPFNLESKNRQKETEALDEEEYYYKNDPNLTITDKLSRDLLVKTLELKDAKLFNNISAKENLLDELLDENEVVIENKYQRDDLNISESLSSSEFKEEYVGVIEKYNLDVLEDDYYLLAMYMESGEESYLQELKYHIDLYEKIENELILMKVSDSGAPVFFEYMNALGKYNDAWEYLVNMNVDPIASLQIIKKIREFDASLNLWANSLRLYFNKKDI